MENDIIYFSDFPNLQETGTRKDNGKFDLTLLPTQELKEELLNCKRPDKNIWICIRMI